MNNETKQTAVEQFSNKAYELFEQYSEGKFDRITLNKLMIEATEQAKEIEKEQIIEAHQEGQLDERDYWTIGDSLGKNRMVKSQMYYNETYGGNK